MYRSVSGLNYSWRLKLCLQSMCVYVDLQLRRPDWQKLAGCKECNVFMAAIESATAKKCAIEQLNCCLSKGPRPTGSSVLRLRTSLPSIQISGQEFCFQVLRDINLQFTKLTIRSSMQVGCVALPHWPKLHFKCYLLVLKTPVDWCVVLVAGNRGSSFVSLHP
eukprot:6208897-Pleurochrysis_carterae.AAC.1